MIQVVVIFWLTLNVVEKTDSNSGIHPREMPTDASVFDLESLDGERFLVWANESDIDVANVLVNGQFAFAFIGGCHTSACCFRQWHYGLESSFCRGLRNQATGNVQNPDKSETELQSCGKQCWSFRQNSNETDSIWSSLTARREWGMASKRIRQNDTKYKRS
jgi:hypothetical protein